MHLVAGATGLVGGGIARELAERGARVRALVRNPEGRPEAGELRELGIEVVAGDLTEPDSLARACQGVDTVVCTVTTMPAPGADGLQRVDREGVQALIEAAEAAGVERFVYNSFSGNLERPSALRDAKREAEDRLRGSAMRAVVLRPSFFMEVWLSPHLGFDPVGGHARIFGSGEAGISYISARDVVGFGVEAALRDEEGDVTLEMGGPEPVSQREAVRIFGEELGREVELEEVPLPALEAQHDTDDPVQRTFAALMLGCAEGDPIPGALETARRYGIELRSVRDWAREVAAGNR